MAVGQDRCRGSRPELAAVQLRMKIFDTLYYSIYRFGRSIGQPENQADACATLVLPLFFYSAGWSLYFTLAYKFDSLWFPPRSFKPVYLVILAFIFVVSFFVFGGRRKHILSEYGKLKNQRIYIWLGAIFSAVTISLPLLWVLLMRGFFKK